MDTPYLQHGVKQVFILSTVVPSSRIILGRRWKTNSTLQITLTEAATTASLIEYIQYDMLSPPYTRYWYLDGASTESQYKESILRTCGGTHLHNIYHDHIPPGAQCALKTIPAYSIGILKIMLVWRSSAFLFTMYTHCYF